MQSCLNLAASFQRLLPAVSVSNRKTALQTGEQFFVRPSIHKQVHPKPMQRRPQHHKYVPDKVRSLGVLHKWDHAKRVNDTAAHDHFEKRFVISEPARNEHDCAPSDNEIQCVVYRPESSRSEYTYDGYPRYNERPLHTEKHNPQGIAPVHKIQRRKCSAYQKVYRRIIKPSPYTLHRKPRFV